MLVKRQHVGIIIRTGLGFKKRLVIRDPVTKLPVNITGSSARLDIKLDPLDSVPYFSFISGALSGGMIIVDGPNGVLDLFASKPTTLALPITAPWLSAVMSCALTMPGQEPLFLFGGPARIVKGINP